MQDETVMNNLWRCNIKTGAKQNVDPAEFCFKNGIVGIGWPLDETPKSKDDCWKKSEAIFKAKHGRSWSAAANIILYRMDLNDLVWSRNSKARYFLGRVTSDWKYSNSLDHRDADVVNFRSCQWIDVGSVDNVPGSVVNSFIPSATVQAVTDETSATYSKLLYNEKVGKPHYQIEPLGDILSLISAEDLEDVVGIYLQCEKDYVLFPSTCKSDTQFVEYILRSKTDHHIAGVQVKSGNVSLEPSSYSSFGDKVYLFAASGNYGSDSKNAVCLSPQKIREFLLGNIELMPQRIQRWCRAYQNKVQSNL